MMPSIPDLPPGLTLLAIVGILATFGWMGYLGHKLVELILNWRKRDNPKEVSALQKENELLKDRVVNLEELVCRLDREINRQLEKSVWWASGALSSGKSREMTAMMNISGALEGRFQVLQELGRGGMGIVFLALDKQLKDNVAIKVLSPFLSNDSESLERLRREVTAARKITHTNVIKIYDIGEANGLHFITMEYFPGQNLRQLIHQKGALSLEEGLQIAHQICDGLEAAHMQGIIHRDLKSQNIVLNEKGHAKIIDLGLAHTNQLDGMTATGLIMGTPEYMSPEQVMGRRSDERSDLYSLGIILYEMFAGRVPFEGDSAISVGFKHVKESYTPLNMAQATVPDHLSAAVDRLLQKDPSHRFQSVAELRKELESLHSFKPINLQKDDTPRVSRVLQS